MSRSKKLYEDIKSHWASVCEDIESGENVDILNEYKQLYWFEKETKKVREQVRDYAIAEASDYSKQELKNMGWEQRNGRSMYNYKLVPEWIQLKHELTELESESKLIASALRDDNENILTEKLLKYNCAKEDLIKMACEITKTAPTFYPKKQ